MKTEFANVLFPSRKTSEHTAVVVGVEHGADVVDLAMLDFAVIGFEPDLEFCNITLNSIANSFAAEGKSPKVKIVPAGLAAHAGKIDITYQGRKTEAKIMKLDDEIQQHVDLMSLDTQQNHYDMLLGAKATMMNFGIDVLWIEMVACDHFNDDLLQFLSEEYELLDFVWWGSPVQKPFDSTSSWEDMMLSIQNYVIPEPSPSIFEYPAEMCKTKEMGYTFLQTDIIAVRRSLFTSNMLHALEKISAECSDDTKRCPLRGQTGQHE